MRNGVPDVKHPTWTVRAVHGRRWVGPWVIRTLIDPARAIPSQASVRIGRRLQVLPLFPGIERRHWHVDRPVCCRLLKYAACRRGS